MLCFGVLFQSFCKPRRVCPILPPPIQPRRRKRQHPHQGQIPALAQGYEPPEVPRADDGRRREELQNRRPTEGHCLRQERDGSLSSGPRRHTEASSRICAFFLWHKHLRLPARPLAQLLSRLHRLLPLWPHKRPRLTRHSQKPRPRSGTREGSEMEERRRKRLHNRLIYRDFQQWRRTLLPRRRRQAARLPRESSRRESPVFQLFLLPSSFFPQKRHPALAKLRQRLGRHDERQNG